MRARTLTIFVCAPWHLRHLTFVKHLINVFWILESASNFKQIIHKSSHFSLGVEPIQSTEHLCLPASLESFQFLYKEWFKNFCTLVKRGVTWIVVTTIIKNFGHICYKFRQLLIISSLYSFFHGGKVLKTQNVKDFQKLKVISMWILPAVLTNKTRINKHNFKTESQ